MKEKDIEMIELYKKSVEELAILEEDLQPLIEEEERLQAEFAVIRKPLKEACKAVSTMKKERGYYKLKNRVAVLRKYAI